MGLYVPKIGSHYFRIAQNLRRRTIGNTATKVEHGDIVGHLLDQVHVMIDEKNRQSVSFKTVQKLNRMERSLNAWAASQTISISVSRSFRKRSLPLSGSSNNIGHEPFKKST